VISLVFIGLGRKVGEIPNKEANERKKEKLGYLIQISKNQKTH